METEYNREICISPMKDNNDDTYVVTIEDEYYSERLHPDIVTTTLITNYLVNEDNIVIKYTLRIDIDGATKPIHKVDTNYRYIYADNIESILYTREDIIKKAVNSNKEIQREISNAYKEFIETNEFQISKSTVRVATTASMGRVADTTVYARIMGRYKSDDISIESTIYLLDDEIQIVRLVDCNTKFRSYNGCIKGYARKKIIALPSSIRVNAKSLPKELMDAMEKLVRQGYIVNDSDMLELENMIDNN